MMKFVLCALFFFPLYASAGVFINEIAWMGTLDSANNEWIELKNDGEEVDISGFILEAQDGTPHIVLGGIISAGGFFLLERTNDLPVPNVSANQIYTGALGNTGETLILKNSSGVIVDEVVSGANWENVGGDNATKYTTQKFGSIWKTSVPTPFAENEEILEEVIEEEEEEIDTPTDDIEESEDIVVEEGRPKEKAKLKIVEIFYDAIDYDTKKEWIEIYNYSSHDANLSLWRLSEGGENHKIVAVDREVVKSGEYAVIADDTEVFMEQHPDFNGLLFDSSFHLSNNGDEVMLLNDVLERVDGESYGKGDGADGDGNSLQKIDGKWFSAIPTPGRKNSLVSANKPEEEKEEVVIPLGMVKKVVQNQIPPKPVVDDKEEVVLGTSTIVLEKDTEEESKLWLFGLLGIIGIGIVGVFVTKR